MGRDWLVLSQYKATPVGLGAVLVHYVAILVGTWW